MKNIKYYLVIGLSAVFTACTDLLDIEPNNKITPNELFNNPNGAKAFMATIYRDLPIEDYMFMPGTSGEGGFNNPTGNIGLLWYANICEEAVQSQWGEQSPGYVIRADYFNHGYETLRNINLLKSIIPTLDIRDSEKKELEGEAAFMTAYVYFYLAEKFGGVPLIKELQEYDPANPGALVVPRSTEYDTWDYVMQQCDLAAAQLPKERSDRRATRWAALALKSRAALYAASIAKFGELAPMEGEAVTKGLAGMKPENAAYFYQHCIDASLTIMTESNHKLYKPNPASPKEAEENYRSIFVNPNQTDGEAIFIKGIVKEGSEFASSLNYFIEPYQTQGQGKMSPALNLVDAYETVNGKLTTDPTNTMYNKQDPYTKRDARFYQSIIYNGSTWETHRMSMVTNTVDPSKNGSCKPQLGKARCGYGPKKFIEELDPSTNLYGGYAQSNNWPYIRYAEVLLNYAEAKNEELAAPDPSVYLAINEVRSRSGQPDLPSGLSKIEMRERIKNERRIELLLEEHRFYDLRRWKDGDVLAEPIMGMNIYDDNVTLRYEVSKVEDRIFNGTHYYLPIPLKEQEKNPLLKD